MHSPCEFGDFNFFQSVLGTSATLTTGSFNVGVTLESSCSGSTPHQVGFVVTADEGFSMSFKFNDHLGSTVISDTYSTFGEAGLVDKAFAAGNMLLLPSGQDEVVYLGAYGDRLDQNNVSSEQARYTDHEYDQETGFNYMKGRYQFPMYAKLNRPDPMRDWDWTRPHTLNLYEYVGNDPINAWDPTGLQVNLRDMSDEEKQEFLESLNRATDDEVGEYLHAWNNIFSTTLKKKVGWKQAENRINQIASDTLEKVNALPVPGPDGIGLDASAVYAKPTGGMESGTSIIVFSDGSMAWVETNSVMDYGRLELMENEHSFLGFPFENVLGGEASIATTGLVVFIADWKKQELREQGKPMAEAYYGGFLNLAGGGGPVSAGLSYSSGVIVLKLGTGVGAGGHVSKTNTTPLWERKD